MKIPTHASERDGGMPFLATMNKKPSSLALVLAKTIVFAGLPSSFVTYAGQA